jgi:simple sugar transport system substrate-binding protein
MLKKGFLFLTFLALFSAALPLGVTAANPPFTFGLLLVGPYNDHGWSQAHFDGGKYVEKMVPGVKMIYIDKVNPADRPGVTQRFSLNGFQSVHGSQSTIASAD